MGNSRTWEFAAKPKSIAAKDSDEIAQDLARESPKCRAAVAAVSGPLRVVAGAHLPLRQKKFQIQKELS